MFLAISDNGRALHSSSLGSDTVLTGATRVLAVSKCTMFVWPISTRTKIAAPYARRHRIRAALRGTLDERILKF